MSNGAKKRDLTRQAANVVGALFQVGATVVASAAIQGVVDEGPRSPVEPALYAFASTFAAIIIRCASDVPW